MDANKNYKSGLPDANPDPVLCCRNDGTVVFCNPAATALVDEFTCRTMAELLPDEHDALVGACLGGDNEIRATNRFDQRVFKWSYRRSGIDGHINIYGHEITEYLPGRTDGSIADISRAALNRLRIPLLVVDDRLCVLFCNDAAEAVLSQSIGLTIRDGVLDSPYAGALDALKSLFEAGRCGEDTLRLPHTPAGLALDVMLLPLPDDASTAMVCLYFNWWTDISIDDSLRKHYGLTAAEARLAECLVKGLTLRECTETLDIAMPTARSHLSGIFKKTGAKCQSKLLVKILTGIVGQAAYLRR